MKMGSPGLFTSQTQKYLEQKYKYDYLDMVSIIIGLNIYKLLSLYRFLPEQNSRSYSDSHTLSEP